MGQVDNRLVFHLLDNILFHTGKGPKVKIEEMKPLVDKSGGFVAARQPTSSASISFTKFLRFEGNMIKLLGHLKSVACNFGSLKGDHEILFSQGGA